MILRAHQAVNKKCHQQRDRDLPLPKYLRLHPMRELTTHNMLVLFIGAYRHLAVPAFPPEKKLP